MKKVISTRDIEAIIANGGDLSSLPVDAIYTPSARDMLNARNIKPQGAPSCPVAAAALAASKVPPCEREVTNIESFFNSPEINKLKEDICDIGRRIWQRDYVDGNGGNISIRVAKDLVLCTPTMVSKGFLKPSDMGFVDMNGNQKAGTKKRTSEILMHLEMMKAQPKAVSCVHAHPPHATAFAVARIQPPTCMIPEMEILVGVAPIADYSTPGSIEMGKAVAALVQEHNTILMANHGVVTWGTSVEDAYWKMEIVDAYCRTIVFATQLGTDLKTISRDKVRELLKIKKSMGFPDSRYGLKECELCDNNEWHPGVVCGLPKQPGNSTDTADAEELVKNITEMIVNKLKN
ncbi:MAG: class II aldolase/adducin family protein [Verrucomicrobia bacterium]|nr:class II aldolase/adducin family protein [Verrucomicrobiota bacterium]